MCTSAFAAAGPMFRNCSGVCIPTVVQLPVCVCECVFVLCMCRHPTFSVRQSTRSGTTWTHQPGSRQTGRFRVNTYIYMSFFSTCLLRCLSRSCFRENSFKSSLSLSLTFFRAEVCLIPKQSPSASLGIDFVGKNPSPPIFEPTIKAGVSRFRGYSLKCTTGATGIVLLKNKLVRYWHPRRCTDCR